MGDLALNLKKMRELKGLSQYKLSEELNIKRSAYGNYETGMSYPEFDTLKKIADYYKMDIRNLLGVDEQFEKSLDFKKEAKEIEEVIKEYYYKKHRKIPSAKVEEKIMNFLKSA